MPLPSAPAFPGMTAARCAATAAPPQDDGAAPSPPAWCAVIELRQYTLHVGQRDTLIDLFERDFVESQEAHGIRVIGTFRDAAEPDRFVWLRGFSGMASRAVALHGFYGGPAWLAQRDAANATMIDSDDVLLLRLARARAGAAVEGAALPRADARAIPASLVEARVFHVDAPPSAELLALVADAVVPLQRDAGAQPLGVLVTEAAENTFPRLPVRAGAQVVVVLSQLRDREADQRYRDALSASARWHEAMAALHAHATAAPEVLLLSPTARSRLR